MEEEQVAKDAGRWTYRIRQAYQVLQEHVIYQGVFFVLNALAEFFLLELFINPEHLDYGVEILLKNVVLIMAWNLLLTGIFHAVRIALLVSDVFFLIVGAANYFIIAFRGYGIVFMDFYAAKTAMSVAGGYHFHVSTLFLVAVLLEILLFLVVFWGLPKRKHAYRNLKYTFWSLLGMAASALFFLWVNFDTVFFKDVSSLSWDHSIGMRDYGYVLYFVSNAGKAGVEKPAGYSVEAIEKELSKYSLNQTEEKQEQEAPAKDHPNLIMIMNESFADLRELGNLKTDRKIMPFYDSLTENAVKGTAYSSVYGGYTANSEFEFLTGCSKLFFPGSPYLQYIDDYTPSLIQTLKAQGYSEATAVHPYKPSGYNRNRVYPLLGFDQFLSLADFSTENLVRKYVGDKEDYEKIEQLYEQKKQGTSLCVFNVTMQNHNAYDDKEYIFEEPVHITNFKADPSAEQYLSLMHMSDQALEELITYFSKVTEPTMILLFGDHQPHLSDAFYKQVMGKVPVLFSEEEIMMEHKVPFLIWANYDIPERTIEKISLNYLSTLLLQTAGLELTGYEKYLSALQKKLPVISASGCYDAEGKLYHYPDKEPDHQEIQTLLSQYEMINYNYIFDKKNCLSRYFEMP